MDAVAMLWIILFGVVCLGLGWCFGYATPRKRDNDGTLEVSETDTSQIHTLEIDIDPSELKHRKRVVFKVKKVSD